MSSRLAIYLIIFLVACAPVAQPAITPTPVSPTSVSPTPLSGLSLTELKYRVLGQFPNHFFCDPDYYPVAIGDEAELARQRFPELQANSEEFQAILNQNGLSGATGFTDEQKLAIYREHKKLSAVHFEPSTEGYQFQLQIEESKGQGFIIKGLIDRQGSITVQERRASIPTCPICLAAGTQIDTPDGPVAVEDLIVGHVVWTTDAAGERVSATILRTSRTPVAAGHEMIHIVLEDGRQLWASPGHPTADERTIGKLRLYDILDGARITSIDRGPYSQPATYDVLPSGETGFYWANGILLASTLASQRATKLP